jgi:predicted O-methyltransferase YrrM
MDKNLVSLSQACTIYESTWWRAHCALPVIVGDYLDEPERGVEIGVGFGGMSIWLTRHYPNLRMICVDPYVVYDPEDMTSRIMSRGDEVHRYVLWRFGIEQHDRLDLWRETSEQAAARVEDGSQDFVFLDADHRYEAIAADIDRWRRKVRPGGMICGHDFSDSWPGVQRAVLERFSTVQVNPASSIWFEVLK